MKPVFIMLLCCLMIPMVAGTVPIRKSKQGVCHTQSSPYYHKLKHFKEYPAMGACLASGGRSLRALRQ